MSHFKKFVLVAVLVGLLLAAVPGAALAGGPIPLPAKPGAQVIKDTYYSSGSWWYGCTQYNWSYTSRFHQVIPEGKVVTYWYKVAGVDWGINCSGKEFYRTTYNHKVKVVWEKATNSLRLHNSTYQWKEVWYGIVRTYRVQYALNAEGYIVVKHLWVNGVKIL